MATGFGLDRPSSGQNIYNNLNAAVYNLLFVITTTADTNCIKNYRTVNGIPMTLTNIYRMSQEKVAGVHRLD